MPPESGLTSMSTDPTDPDLPELSYAGIPTFLKAPQSSFEDLGPDVDVGVLGVPFDGAVSRQPGARHGPSGIRSASGWYAYLGGYKGGLLNVETDREVAYSDLTIRDCGDAPTVPTSVDRTRDHVQAAVEQVAARTFPLTLGGDHYITYPAYMGYATTVDERVGVIQIDAHTDTTEESTLYGKHFHGTPMARIAESPYGGYDAHAMIGIRGYEGPEFGEIASESGLYVDYADDVRDRGIRDCIRGAIDHVTDRVDTVYLTVDIDGVDPAFAPGTGTPEPGGLTSADLLTAMDLLGDCAAIGAMDVMEVAPGIDPTEATQRLAANAIVRFLEAKFL